MTPLTLGQLIRQLTLALERHGDCAVYVETESDELDLYTVESHHVHSDTSKPLVVCISTKQEP